MDHQEGAVARENNLHLCVCGTKQWKLYPPSSISLLNYVSLWMALKSLYHEHDLPYAGKKGRKTRGGPSMSIQNENDKKATQVPHVFVLNAGDALYLPAGWHHEVTTIKHENTVFSCAGDSGSGDGTNIADKKIDFVYSLNRFYTTSLCSLLMVSMWSWYVVARLRLYQLLKRALPVSAVKIQKLKKNNN